MATTAGGGGAPPVRCVRCQYWSSNRGVRIVDPEASVGVREEALPGAHGLERAIALARARD